MAAILRQGERIGDSALVVNVKTPVSAVAAIQFVHGVRADSPQALRFHPQVCFHACRPDLEPVAFLVLHKVGFGASHVLSAVLTDLLLRPPPT